MSATDVRFAVRLTPRAAVDRVDGVTDGVLRARVGVVEELGVARSDVRIVAGAASRQKLVVIDGADPDAIVARWPGLRV